MLGISRESFGSPSHFSSFPTASARRRRPRGERRNASTGSGGGRPAKGERGGGSAKRQRRIQWAKKDTSGGWLCSKFQFGNCPAKRQKECPDRAIHRCAAMSKDDFTNICGSRNHGAQACREAESL